MTVRYSSSTALQMISNIQSQQQTIIVTTWIIHPFDVGNQGPHQCRQVEEVVPIGIVAGQTRDFPAKNNAYMTQRQLASELGKVIAPLGRCCGTAQAGINHLSACGLPPE